MLGTLIATAGYTSGCQTSESSPATDGRIINAQPPLTIAHRGASYDAPENTLAAFALAWEREADGIECDVHLTADGVLVCLHDKDTGRTGDGGGEKGTGLIAADSTLKELQSVEVGAWKHSRFAGERMPTLAGVLQTVPPSGRVFVEIKAGLEAVPPLLAVLEASPLEPSQIVVISFNAEVVRAVKRGRDDLTVNWLTGFERDDAGGFTPSIEAVLEELADCGADGLGCKFIPEHVDADFVNRLTDAGFGFHVWTVNTPEPALKARSLGAQSITTDRPGRMREWLATPRTAASP